MRAALALAGLTACVIPPSQSTLAAVATPDGVGTRVSVGAHASALDDGDDLDVDLGAGWVAEQVDRRGTAHGTYASLARRGPGRWWFGGRAEQYWDTAAGQPTQALVARVAWRRHLAGVRAGTGDGRGALGILGAIATATFLDVGARRRDGGGGEGFAAVGLALELPALAGVSR